MSVVAASLPLVAGFMFDVDGTLLLSDRALGNYELLPGAVEALTALKTRSVPFVLLTNGSAYPPAEQAAKLRKSGLPVEDGQMITPSSVAADHLSRRGVKRVLVLGTRGVGHALTEAGIHTLFTGDAGAREVDAVYVGWHPECGMKDIEAAAEAVWGGAKLYSASEIAFFASKQGRTIGYSYAIIGAISRLTKARATVMGKPSAHAMRYVARKLGMVIEQIGVVGDDPVAEALMARRTGAVMFGVTTGSTSRQQWAQQPEDRRPHRVIDDLRELLSTTG